MRKAIIGAGAGASSWSWGLALRLRKTERVNAAENVPPRSVPLSADLPNCLQRSRPLVGASGLPASSPLVPSRPTCPAAGGRGGDHGPFSRRSIPNRTCGSQ